VLGISLHDGNVAMGKRVILEVAYAVGTAGENYNLVLGLEEVPRQDVADLTCAARQNNFHELYFLK